MSRQTKSSLSVLLIALVVATGCHPTQPFYLEEDGDLSHYLDKVTELEYPDVCAASLAEVTYAEAPFTLSDPEPREIWDLSLEEVVSIAMHNSKVIRNLGQVTQFGFADALIERTAAGASTVYDPAVVEADPQNGIEAALSAFDAQLSMVGTNSGNFFTQTDRPNLFGFAGGDTLPVIRRDNGGVRTELGKRTAGGTQVFARNVTEYQRGDNLIGGALPVNSVWETLFELEVRQPLMRGRGCASEPSAGHVGPHQRRHQPGLVRGERPQLCAGHREYLLGFVSGLPVPGDRQSGPRRGPADLALRLREVPGRGRRYVDGGSGPRAVLLFRAALEQALQQLHENEARLRYLMGLTATDGRLIRPLDDPTTARIEFDWRSIHAEALARSPELRQLKWAIKRRELELIASRNQLLPQLDIGATYRWYGIGDNLINSDRNGQDFINTDEIDGSTAFDVLTQGDYQEAAFFLNFQMPVGYRRELAGVRAAQLALAREFARLEDTELNQSHLLATAVRRLDFLYQNTETHFNRWNASSREVASAQQLFAGGKTTIDQLLDAQRRRAESQRDYYQSLSDYNKALADIHFRKGSLLEYNNVYLAEGPWPQKAYWDAMDRARERDASYYMNYGWSRPRVVSQGPVEQHTGSANETITDYPTGPVRTEERTTRDPQAVPQEEPVPAEPAGPITSVPTGPSLLTPNLRASADPVTRPVTADRAPVPFDWSSTSVTDQPLGTGVVRRAAYNQ